MIRSWLGDYQTTKTSEPDGGWEWVTGEKFTYMNWATGQPNNLGKVQDFRHYWTTPPVARAATWDDNDGFEGGFTRGYVVESKVNPIPIPASGLRLMAGLGGLALMRRGA